MNQEDFTYFSYTGVSSREKSPSLFDNLLVRHKYNDHPSHLCILVYFFGINTASMVVPGEEITQVLPKPVVES